jgi:hypothetical protein
VVVGTVDSVERGRFVDLVDDADRKQQETHPEGQRVAETKVEVGLLHRHFTTGLATSHLRVLHFELGPEGDSVGEAVPDEEDEASEADHARRIGRRGVGIVYLTVAAKGGAFGGRLGRQPMREKREQQGSENEVSGVHELVGKL